MSLEDAKVSSFSSDFQTLSKIILPVIPCTNWVKSLCQRLQIEFFPLVYGSHNSHVAITQQENQDPYVFCCEWGRGAIYSNTTHKIGNWKCWFLRRGEARVPSEKPLGVRERTNNKLNPRWDLNLGHTGGRQVLSPLLHPSSLLSVKIYYYFLFIQTGFLCSTPATTHMIMIFIHKCKRQIYAQKNNKLNVMIHKITGFIGKTFGLL